MPAWRKISFANSYQLHRPLVGGVIAAVLVGLDHVNQKSCQVIGVGRGSNLIIYHADCPALFAETQHSLDEVLSCHAEYPGNAHDKVFVGQFFYRQLTLVLSLTVYI